MKLHAVALCAFFATAFAGPVDLRPRAQGTRTVTQTITGPNGHITKTVTRVATGTNVAPPPPVTKTQQTTVTAVNTVTVKSTKTQQNSQPPPQTKTKKTTTPAGNTVTVTKTQKGSSPTGQACSGGAVGTCTSNTVGCTCSVVNLLGVAVYGTCSAGLLGGYSCNIL